jgi:hypothetical protein
MVKTSTYFLYYILSFYMQRLVPLVLLLIAVNPLQAQPAGNCSPTFLNNLQIIMDASCNKNDGHISIIPLSGVPPFQYSINGGTTYTNGPNTGYTFFNLAEGTYYLRLKDSNGCVSPSIPRVVTTRYGGPTFSNDYSLIKNPTCLKNDGSITILPTNPNASYGYSIDGGTTYVPGPSGGYTFLNLTEGLYNVRLRIIDGCQSEVSERYLNAAPLPQVVTKTSDEVCSKTNGTLSIFPSHGAAPYMYSLNDGATFSQGPETGLTINALSAGNYPVTIKDARGCKALTTTAVVINNPDCSGTSLPTFPQINGILPLQPLTTDESLLTYPNPGTGKFTLKFQQFISPKVEVSIYNMNGYLVEKRWVNPIRFKTSAFDLTAHPAGVYYLKVISVKGTTSTKVVIQ